MAVDYNELYKVACDLHVKTDAIRHFAEVARTAKTTVAFVGDINFTPAQKTALLAKYSVLKGEVQALVALLPEE